MKQLSFYFKTNCNSFCNANNNRSVTFKKPSTEVTLQYYGWVKYYFVILAVFLVKIFSPFASSSFI